MKVYTKKTLSAVLALLIALSAISCLSVISFAADEVIYEAENNDESVSAQVVSVDKKCIGKLSDEDDVDWYKFESNTDYFILDFGRFETKSSLNIGWNVTLYDSNFNQIKSYYDYYDGVIDFNTVELPFKGTFFISVTSCYNVSQIVNVEYAFTVITGSDKYREKESNDVSENANNINVNEKYYGAFYQESDVDWYTFESNADYFVLNFGVKNTANSINVGWNVTLYDSNFAVIKDYSEYYDGFTSFQTAKLPFKGTFYVKVSSCYDGSVTVDVDYALTATTGTDSYRESENNDTAETANTIQVNQKYVASFYKENDVDWYVVETNNDYFTVELSKNLVNSSLSDGWNVCIYDEQLNTIAQYQDYYNGYTKLISQKLPYKGKIYIRVYPCYHSDNTIDAEYTIKVNSIDEKNVVWETEVNSSLEKANLIKMDNTYKGNLSSSSDTDYYQFYVSSFCKANIKFERGMGEVDSDAGWVYSIKDAAGNTLYSNCSRDLTATSDYFVLTKGFYFLVVTQKSGYYSTPSGIDYSFKINQKDIVPTVSKVENVVNGVKVSWGKINEADGYIVYRKAGSATSWTKVYTAKSNTVISYTDKNVKSGTKYTYTVKAYNGSSYSAYNQTGKSVVYLAQPTAKAANQNGSVKVSWGKITGANSYIVYRKAGSATKWTKVATVTTNTYTDKSVKSGTKYTYTVKAVNGSYVSAYNTKGVAVVYLAQPTLGTPVSAKAGVTVKWGKVAGATGYIVYRKTGSGSYAKIATVKGNTTVSYLDKSAKKGTTYTYTVKAYYGDYVSTCNTKGVSIKDKY